MTYVFYLYLLQGKTDKFCGTAYISFKNEMQKNELIETHKMTFSKKIKKFFGKLEQNEDDLCFFGKKMILE